MYHHIIRNSHLLFLTILSALTAQMVVQCIATDFMFTPHNYAAIACISVVIILAIIKPRAAKIGTAALLILGAANIINFTVYRNESSFFINDVPLFWHTDKMLFGLLFGFYLFNFRSVNSIVKRLLVTSPEEKAEASHKKIAFYNKQFETCSNEELVSKLSYFESYPEEAQIALQQVLTKRGLSLSTSLTITR